ncbi:MULTISPECIES: dicarboxylate/amino acid:cation symporter [Brevundimonas]|uniref:dicarboxylate/amino acid:cation symporter n=1 Tax=Brevundimonas TaxID=41275 RepID=UPI00190414CD|nr:MULTISPECIES: dicarboxylate/amino acid:cation symporter [Brevundimonas]MDA0743041.1 dicarboxylate/amino acid:cation symporter [Pseudomonadota bacterium]MBK1968038.1 dicarboxylate/amino acid:cation symporter [Brevundimonas diminuta]MBK1974688.1 dicarboxylate/amino acid:cation symporter [Brevundimonas diminuta]MDA1321753.1 dicarboxylate/amino acid:cation symporter [Pseudomonadota bacterium]MDM8351356.1 dicarboxylate/amino acid:cation symporter [Brevundimonas diminuta]
MKRLFAYFIIGAMVLGVLTGWGLNHFLTADQASSAASNLNLITDVFLRLIKMIIAPLVFTTLVAGIAHMEDAASVGRIGVKTMTWFIGASIVSLVLGLVMVQLLQPGANMHLPEAVAASAPAASTDAFSLHGFITHLVPTSIFDAMAKNEILQIVVFSVFVGTAVAALDDKAPAVLHLVEQAASIMLKVTEFVMKLAPFAIFAALASTIATQGLEMLGTYAKFVLGFYGSMGVLWGLLFLAGAVVLGKRVIPLFREIRTPTLLAFSTASSEAAYPRILEALPKVGVRRRIVSFVLPLGYSFNLDGSMLYCTFGTMFIMQAHGVHLSVSQQIFMLLLLMVTSKGIAGIPRASLVVIMATLTYFGLPEAWIAIVLGVDHLLDMGRSATNVVGNSVAAAVVAKWEGELDDMPEADGQDGQVQPAAV